MNICINKLPLTTLQDTQLTLKCLIYQFNSYCHLHDSHQFEINHQVNREMRAKKLTIT
jgi:hypothetical protein